jgi:hypothetical protein
VGDARVKQDVKMTRHDGLLLREVARESADVCRSVQDQDFEDLQARGLRQGTQ